MSEPSERVWGCRCYLCDADCGRGEGLAAAHFDPDGSLVALFCGTCVGTGTYARLIAEATYAVVSSRHARGDDLIPEDFGL